VDTKTEALAPEYEQSENINELAKALAAAQGTIEAALKDKTNPHFRSHYADISSVWEACRGPLSKNGLSIIQAPGNGILVTQLNHSSGQWIRTRTKLLIDKANMQGLGSALTYARRYALAAMVGVVADEDDDGNEASKPTINNVTTVAKKFGGEGGF
jgi:hypothetical protein